MKSISGKEFAKLLEKKDWELRRTKGSHHIYGKAGRSARIAVPVHGNGPRKIGLLRHFMKVVGIDESELLYSAHNNRLHAATLAREPGRSVHVSYGI